GRGGPGESENQEGACEREPERRRCASTLVKHGKASSACFVDTPTASRAAFGASRGEQAPFEAGPGRKDKGVGAAPWAGACSRSAVGKQSRRGDLMPLTLTFMGAAGTVTG